MTIETINGKEYSVYADGNIKIINVPAQPQKISMADFIERFTEDEKIDIASDPGYSPVLSLLIKLLPSFSIDNPKVADFLNDLEIEGLLKPGRADEILGGL